MFRELWRSTVWAPQGVPFEYWRFRGLFQFVLPITYLLFVYFGVTVQITGIESVETLAGQDWQTAWSAAVTASAANALVGTVFPGLWWLEAVGIIPLIGLVSMYIVLLLAYGIGGEQSLATAGLVVIVILLPVWRVGDLGAEFRRRRREM